MSAARFVAPALVACLVSASLLAQGGQPARPPAAAAPDACAKPWLGHEGEFEES